MNSAAHAIADRLSLRPPQRRSLDILAAVANTISLRKGSDAAAALQSIKALYPSVESFERDFPSLCFQLATGVGKTRLMGAFIAYLHAEKGIRHFFVLAPNLTIYNKLIQDFTPNTPKYVLQGLAEFAARGFLLITGDNYNNQRLVRRIEPGPQHPLFDESVHINIFNISKLNKDASDRGGQPRIKQLSEYIGQSYFDYLVGLDDLVLLMDESHRYRADAGVRVLNELKPVLGLELTATPQTESSKGAVKFKNVIYSYPLSEAMKDGFVKEPAVATRKDFVAKDHSEEELERIKLEDAIHVHESVKVDLEVYSRETGRKRVKPFVLVIAKDTTHAGALEQVIKGETFFSGRYQDRVITVHSKKGAEEKDEVVERLLQVESADEPTEIVIHVDMLKEGWDVANLYTVVPLRAANSKTLIEQSIGRGLRLPFGARTGVKALDRLTIIAHDRFQEILDEAGRPESVIRAGVVIGVDVPIAGQQLVTVPSRIEERLFGSATRVTDSAGNSTALAPTGAPTAPALVPAADAALGREVLAQIERASKDVAACPTAASLLTEGLQEAVFQGVAEASPAAQASLPGFEEKLKRLVAAVAKQVVAGTIEIPRVLVVPEGAKSGYRDFDLDTGALHHQPVEQSILLKHLRDSSVTDVLGVADTGPAEQKPEDYLLRGMFEFDDVDYQANAVLLNKLALQAVAKLRSYLTEEADVLNVVQYHQRQLADFIHAQLKERYWETATEYAVKVHQGFTVPEPLAYAMTAGAEVAGFRLPVANRSEIRNLVFGGFEKCLFSQQKFDSDIERRFAVVLEDDPAVEKWCKPNKRAFQISLPRGKQFEPDFVVETEEGKFLVEVKQRSLLEAPDTVEKAEAAVTWCQHASEHEAKHQGKPWRYVLVPDDAVVENMSLAALVMRFGRIQ